YIIDKLYNNPLYREYKISYLAEECGYSSHQVFITAFRKETGMTPSYFIKQLSIKQRIKD
ncbi:helix-turn-helix domain-containing protein, partial [Elizabethkingia miricola]